MDICAIRLGLLLWNDTLNSCHVSLQSGAYCTSSRTLTVKSCHLHLNTCCSPSHLPACVSPLPETVQHMCTCLKPINLAIEA